MSPARTPLRINDVVRAVEDASYRQGYRVLLCNTDEQPEKQRSYLGVLTAERVAGAIISPTGAKAPEIGELIDHGTCVVAFDRDIADGRADAAVAANAEGARTGTAHLIACGHSKVGYISGPLRVETGAERLHGYDECMKAAKLTPIIAYGDFRYEAGARATRELLARVPLPCSSATT